MAFVAPFITQIDVGCRSCSWVGCMPELFGTGRVNAIRDLKGKTVAVPELGSPHDVFTAAMASHVGIDPNRDINFVTRPPAESMQLLADGKIDALMALLHLLRSGIGTTRANGSGEIRSADWGEVEALKTRCKACC